MFFLNVNVLNCQHACVNCFLVSLVKTAVSTLTSLACLASANFIAANFYWLLSLLSKYMN